MLKSTCPCYQETGCLAAVWDILQIVTTSVWCERLAVRSTRAALAFAGYNTTRRIDREHQGMNTDA
jgi:hypothetical protein